MLGKAWESVLGCRKSLRRDGCGEVMGRGVGKCVGMWER